MEILHSLWDEENLHFWIEKIDFDISNKNVLHNNPSIEFLSKHPNTLSFSQILTFLRKMDNNIISKSDFQTNQISLPLPSTNEEPLPTILKINEKQFDQKKWLIDSISFKPKDALELLVILSQQKNRNKIFSDSSYFWLSITRFTLEMISKESFLPSFEMISHTEQISTFTGKWKIKLNDEDKERFNLLVKKIPKNSYQIKNNENSIENLLKSFMDSLTDVYIRRNLSVYYQLFKENQEFTKMNNITHQWFESLFTQDEKAITCSMNEFVSFIGNLKTWYKKIIPEFSERLFKTCIKLDQTNSKRNDQSWKMSYYLQAIDDLSLIIPSNEIWKMQTKTINFLEGRYENPQTRLLNDLEKAAKIYPKINESLNQTFPIELNLSENEVLFFFDKYYSELEQNGFQILLPKWLKDPKKIILNLEVLDSDNLKTFENFFKLNKFLHFDWKIALGDSKLTIQEFEQLSKLKVPFAKIRGQWLSFDQEELNEALEIINSKYQKLTINDAIKLGLKIEKSTKANLNLKVQKGTFLEDLLEKAQNSDKIIEIPQPENFQGQLRPYQLDGLSWLVFLKKYNLGACLADDMGLGKTIQLISFLLHQKNNFSLNSPTLIICPTSIIGNWYREFQKFAPSLSVLIHHGINRIMDESLEFNVSNYDVVLTTYHLIQRDFTNLSRISWEIVVLDEAQNIKNPYAKQTQVIKDLQSNYRIILTGTPVENRLSELWSIFDFINPNYLGSLNKFSNDFITIIEKDHNKEKSIILSNLIKPFILRRLKTDSNVIKDLPEKIESNIYCSLTEEQAILYEAVTKALFEELNNYTGIERKGLVLSTITKLKQICNHPAQFIHDSKGKLENRSCKFTRLIEMLEEILSKDEKILIFTQYKELGELLQRFLEEQLFTKVLFLCGDTSQKDREAYIQHFQDSTNSTSPKIFILSIKAGGVGLNLTAANHVFHFDRWWNPAVENQATDRAFRIGQSKNVFVHKFVCIGTLEESIDQLIYQKKNLAEAIITTNDNWLTELSIDELRKILTLKTL